MKRTVLLPLLVLVLLTSILIGQVSATQSTPQLNAVYVIKVDGTIELGLSQFVLRGLKQAEEYNAAVVLEINTFGGRVDAATEIRDYILRMQVPVIAFVRERAISAGALITIAAPHIVMAPGSAIGAAQPIPSDPKTISALRAEFEATAERNGRNPIYAGAMVDPDVVIEGVTYEGKVLTFRAAQALEYGYTDLLAETRLDVLEHYDLEGLEVVELKRNWAEKVVGFITAPTVSQLLLTLGILGLLVEVITVGWGVPGTIGLVAMGLFFGGRMLTGLVGFEVVILFVIGLVLLALEIFVIPGFGIAGILGLAALFASIVMAYGSISTAITSITIAVLISIAVIVIFWRRFRKSSGWSKLILLNQPAKNEEVAHTQEKYSDLVGKQGVAITPLRPAGIALIDSVRYDVVSEGGFIANNSKIEVVKIEGYRIVVREIMD